MTRNQRNTRSFEPDIALLIRGMNGLQQCYRLKQMVQNEILQTSR